MLLAEVDWNAALTGGVTAVVTVGTMLGGGIAWLLKHNVAQRDAQRSHENNLVARMDAIAVESRRGVSEVAREFQDTTKQLAKDSREESRKTVNTLLDIQKETVEAVGSLSQRVGELGHAITSLQHEMTRKADREE